MRINLQPGKYIVAVSGGVDSMALLDMLIKGVKSQEPRAKAGRQLNGHSKIQDPKSTSQFVVAHFDHGIRPDSVIDRRLVQRYAADHNLPFVYQNGRLGKAASEATARQARYRFLREVQSQAGASAIITAHHQDDVLETAIINMIRGTGRKGLSSLQSGGDILRPLLSIKKSQLQRYAKQKGLPWREDSTNQDDSYLRNYVRHQVLGRFSASQRTQLGRLISAEGDLNRQLDQALAETLRVQAPAKKIDKLSYVNLPHAVARELMASWLRQTGSAELDKKTIERLTVAAKTAKIGAVFDVNNGWQLKIYKDNLALEHSER